MYSDKPHVLHLVALLKAYHIRHIVLSPGSRNAPLIHSFSQDDDFNCYVQVDERNAAFFALGLIQKYQEPVAICCTSGTALLNFTPAVAEAYYQQLPLIVISADRPAAWIDQMDGQTIQQAGCLTTITQCQVHLPEITGKEQEWHCNRLINQALIAVSYKLPRPVHINIPITEPLFNYTIPSLPIVRKIEYCSEFEPVLSRLSQYNTKTLIIVGQLLPDCRLTPLLEYCVKQLKCVVLVEHLANQQSKTFINNIDSLLASLDTEQLHSLRPTRLITLGGHIVSKRLKQFLRTYPADIHWQISPSGDIVDVSQHVTHIIAQSIYGFLLQFTKQHSNSLLRSPDDYIQCWQQYSRQITTPDLACSFSDLYVTGLFIQMLSNDSQLHLANSSSVRLLQLFPIPPGLKVYCNRGTNGIEGTLSTAIGFAVQNEQPVYVLIGDLSFFYNVNALWPTLPNNLRILLLNNGGGGIFHLLPQLNQSSTFQQYVAAQHHTSVKAWLNTSSIHYRSASNKQQLTEALTSFTSPSATTSMLLEVHTDIQLNKSTFTDYYQLIKEKRY